MFRRPAARLRQLAAPFLKRGALRTQTSGAEQAFRPNAVPKPFWSSSRVLLFTALTGTTTYFFGLNDDTPRFQLPWRGSARPRYASKHEMEKACCEGAKNTRRVLLANHLCRPSRS